MADIPRDPTALHKSVTDYRVESASDIRELTERCRALSMMASAAIECAEFEIRSALTWFDSGNGRRASSVTRPMRNACTLHVLAARRCVTVWRQYHKMFADQRSRRGDRKFDPEK
jgi:hypothetical protein